MEDILKVVKKEELTNQYIRIEYCGNTDSNLEDYYFVILKEDKDELAMLLRPESEMEKQDIENRIISNNIKDFILDYLDSSYDSITAHFIDVYGGIDEFLMHYGYLEMEEDPGSFYSEAELFNDFSEEEEEEEPNYNIHMYDEEPVVEAPAYKEPPKPVVIEESSDLQSEMIKVIIKELNLDYDAIRKEAEMRMEAKLHPELDRQGLEEALDMLISLGVYTESDKNFITLSYDSGNVLEVTELLGQKCREVKRRGY